MFAAYLLAMHLRVATASVEFFIYGPFSILVPPGQCQ